MSGPRHVSQQSVQSVPAASPNRAMRARQFPPAAALGAAVIDATPLRLRRSAELDQFVSALLTADDATLDGIVDGYLERSGDVTALYEGIFAEAARELGEMWASDDCSFYEVTIASGRIHRLIRDLGQRGRDAVSFYPGSTGRILLACAHDEQHSLGLTVLAEFFVRDGWDVQISAGLGSEALLDRVRDSEYNLLGFSVAVTARIAKLQQDIRRSRQVSRKRDIRVLVGGQLITADPSLAERIGADGYAADARSALREARRLLSA